MIRLLPSVLTVLSVLLVSGCATISKEDCHIGAWAEYGYEDGLKGKSSDRVADYAKKCAKYNVQPDMQTYLESYERGIEKYCTFERGYERGESGSSYNQACSGPLAAEFAPGYEEGRVVYEIRREHERLISDYESGLNELSNIRRRLREDNLTDKDRRRLINREVRLEYRLKDLRRNIRAYERKYNLRRYGFR